MTTLRHWWPKIGAARWGSRVTAVLAVAGAACAATLFAGVGPAYAITGRTLVTATSGSSSVNKTATATCPAGTIVIGTGGEIIGGLGRVLITDLVPNLALTSVSVTGGENGAFTGNWQVRAQAMCAPVSTIGAALRITAAASNNGTSDFSKSATVTCPAGLRVFGTGYQTTNAAGNVAVMRVRPDAGLTYVETLATETNTYGSTWDWEAYAICGLARTTMTRVSAVSTLDSNPVHGIMTNPCAAGTTLTGVGAYSEALGATGWLHIDQLSLDLVNDRVAVNAWEDPVTGYPSNWDEQAFAICVS